MKKEIKEAKIIKVIKTRSVRGSGAEKDLVREVDQYWDLKGKKLFESDPKERNEINEKQGDQRGRVVSHSEAVRVTDMYADNQLWCQEISICLSTYEWHEFSNQEFYPEVVEFLCKKGIQVNIENLGGRQIKK